jgi:peptidoglycan-N-acetylglucosamine deacetylase
VFLFSKLRFENKNTPNIVLSFNICCEAANIKTHKYQKNERGIAYLQRGAAMRVVTCWDDGVVDDARLIDILRKYGAKASFNLNFGSHQPARYLSWKYRDQKEVWKLAVPELHAVYAGFLVANHTLTHAWPTHVTEEQMRADIFEGRDALEQHFGYPVTGFAYPFGDYNAAVKQAVRESGALYARTTQNTARVFPPQDAMEFHSSCHHAALEFWEAYERVRTQDGVFYFWGHAYEFVTETDWQVIEEKIARISADPAAQWCDLPALFG